jgi:DNA-binding transcriptional LysR family regulator
VSAVSHALTRLREAFDDPLFVRVARGLAPTALARNIEADLLDTVRRGEALFARRPSFEPARATGRIVIAIAPAPGAARTVGGARSATALQLHLAWPVERSDVALSAPSLLLSRYQERFAIRVLPCPVSLGTIDVRMIWHDQTHRDPLRVVGCRPSQGASCGRRCGIWRATRATSSGSRDRYKSIVVCA